MTELFPTSFSTVSPGSGIVALGDNGTGPINVDMSSVVNGLWYPGAPTLANWTVQNLPFINTCTVTQNGTKAVSILTPTESGSGTAFGGWSIAPPATPYKVLFGAAALNSSIGFGWIDTAGKSFYFGSNTVQGDFIGYATSFLTSSVDVNTYVVSGSNYIYSYPYFQIILHNDGTNVSFISTVDGATGYVLYQQAISALPIADVNKLFIAVGPCDANTVFASAYNIFQYDPNAILRLPTAPGY